MLRKLIFRLLMAVSDNIIITQSNVWVKVILHSYILLTVIYLNDSNLAKF